MEEVDDKNLGVPVAAIEASVLNAAASEFHYLKAF
jgi:hypothetical protein